MALGILVVDDNDGQRELLKTILEYQGHTVIMATNGRIAINMINSNWYDLVITDLHMPQADGFQVVSHIKRFFPRTKVILTTAYSEIVKGKDVFADKFLRKPYDTGEIKQAIAELFPPKIEKN